MSENCKWRIRKDFADGKTMNLALLYGYRGVKGKIEIVPEEAEVVRRLPQRNGYTDNCGDAPTGARSHADGR